MHARARSLLLACLALVFWCGTGLAATLTVTSPAFKDGERMPRSIGCETGDHSPALSVSDVPSEAKSLAIFMTAENGSKGRATLWMAFNIPAAPTVGLAESQPRTRQMKGEGVQLDAVAGKPGYHGPCPPSGVTRACLIEVFALDTLLDLPENATWEQFLLAVEGHILARGKLTGKFKK